MTIRKGQPWGEPSALPADAVPCASDAQVAAALGELRAPEAGATVALTGGDLFRTLGGQPGSPRWLHGEAMAFPIDAVRVELDGVRRVAVAHVVARQGRWWAGPTLVVMNAAFLGAWYLGPRAHPNDGLVDVTEGRLPWGQRSRGRRRMPAGAHLPHPDLAESRVRALDRTFPIPQRVWLDGLDVGTVTTLRVEVVPDAFSAIV